VGTIRNFHFQCHENVLAVDQNEGHKISKGGLEFERYDEQMALFAETEIANPRLCISQVVLFPLQVSFPRSSSGTS
jgi:hypothetical protein